MIQAVLDPDVKDLSRLCEHIETFLMRLDSAHAYRTIALATNNFLTQGANTRLAFVTAFTMEFAENNLCH